MKLAPSFCALALVGLSVSTLSAQTSPEEAPIFYGSSEVHDPVAQLQDQIESGEVELLWDEEHGYLTSLLERLDIPVSSQMLVFSKTSFQLRRITPRQPRAVYFNDEVYIGWVQEGSVVEISSVDPNQGAIFYSLQQRESETPQFTRHTHDCTQCHSSSLTHNIPGHIVRSVIPAQDGTPILREGTHLINHKSPMERRWGGWYVTGSHGDQQHMGNTWIDSDEESGFDASEGQNQHTLEGICNTEPYLSPHSDIAALMVLEHQTYVQNLITAANYMARQTAYRQAIINGMLERPEDYLSEADDGILDRAAEKLVQGLLLIEETELTAQIAGTSGFAEEFQQRGPVDNQGRSLRQLDLRTRLFKYPCSYLIYSDAFDTLPDSIKGRVLRQIWSILTGENQSETYAHLRPEDRLAILEILRETKRDLPDYWRG